MQLGQFCQVRDVRQIGKVCEADHKNAQMIHVIEHAIVGKRQAIEV